MEICRRLSTLNSSFLLDREVDNLSFSGFSVFLLFLRLLTPPFSNFLVSRSEFDEFCFSRSQTAVNLEDADFIC